MYPIWTYHLTTMIDILNLQHDQFINFFLISLYMIFMDIFLLLPIHDYDHNCLYVFRGIVYILIFVDFIYSCLVVYLFCWWSILMTIICIIVSLVFRMNLLFTDYLEKGMRRLCRNVFFWGEVVDKTSCFMVFVEYLWNSYHDD